MFSSNDVVQFSETAKAFLSKQNINYLRAYARSVGVEKPTEKKKEDLIQAVIDIKTGRISPIEQSKRGAPLRNDYFPNEIACFIDDLVNGILLKTHLKKEKNERGVPIVLHSPDYVEEKAENFSLNPFNLGKIYRGQIQYFNNVPCLIPLNCKKAKETVIFSEKQLEDYELREGDIVTCKVKRGENALVADIVLTRNELVITPDAPYRNHFEDGIPCYPNEKIRFVKDGENNGVAMKYLDWVFQIGKGQRGCIVASPKSGKTRLLYEMAQAVRKVNRNVKLLTLLVDQSPENVAKFQAVLRDDEIVATTYEDEPEKQVFAAEFLLKRAKRLVESGRDVVLLIDAFNALAWAYNDTDASSGGKTLEGGLESKTLHYIKKFFAAARCLGEQGSLTIVGAVSSGTGNPADELICRELVSVANLDIRFNEDLAVKRIYPAFDLLASSTHNEGTLKDDDLDRYLRLIYIPNNGMEKLLKDLDESLTYENFLEKIKD